MRALVGELEQEIAAGEDPHARAELFLQLGLACEELVPERGRALALFRKAIESDPRHSLAIEQARRICLEQAHLDPAVDLLEAELRAEESPERAVALSVVFAESLLDLGQRERALRHLVSATAEHPQEAALQEALATAGSSVDWRAEVTRLSEMARDLPAQEAARFCLRAARILKLEAPGDPEYEWMLMSAFTYDSADPVIGGLLESHLIAQKAWRELSILQAERVAAAGDETQQAARCLGYAFLWKERFNDPDRAAAWCFQALALGAVPFPIAACTLIAELLGPRGEWPKLLNRLDELLAHPIDEDAQVFVMLLGARVVWQEMNDLPRTRADLEHVRHLAPGHPVVLALDDALAGTETISPEQQPLVEAAQALEAQSPERAIDGWKRAIAADPARRGPHRQLARLLRQLKRWRQLTEALNAQDAAAALAPDDRLNLLFELAALYRVELRHDVNFESTLGRILSLKPDSLTALDLLATHHSNLRRWSDLVATLGRMVPLVDVEARVTLHLSRAQLLRERLANEQGALRELEAAVALSPGSQELAAQLDQAYERRREWEKLLNLRASRIEKLEDPAERLHRSVELARFAAQRVRTPPLVIEAWEAVTDLEPYHPEALAVLEQLYGRERRFNRLAEIYAKQAQAAPESAEKAAALQKLAIVCSERLDDNAGAIDAWTAVLEVTPGNPRAEDALKRLYVAQKAWDVLEAFFAARGKLEECARVLERRLESEDATTRVQLWERVARLHQDALGKPDRAKRAWEAVRELEPGHRAAAVALISHYEKERDLPKLAQVLAVQLEHTTSPDARHARLRHLAELHGEWLGDAPGAFRWLLRAFTEDVTHDGVRRQLEELAARTGAWAELARAYEEALSRFEPPTAALPLLRVLAEVRETKLNDQDAALSTWRYVLNLDESSMVALDALERLYLARHSYDELQSIYDHRIALLKTPAEKRPLQLKIARLAEEKGDLARAVAALESVLSAAHDDRVTLAALERLHRRREDWPALARSLERRLDYEPDDVDPRFDLAEVREQHLADLLGAIEGYRRVLELSPSHGGARAALERHVSTGEHRREVAAVLDPIYQRAGEYDKLVGVREVLLEHATGPERQVELLHGIAELLEQKLTRPQAAFEALARALRVSPGNPATLDRLERLAGALSAWEPLVAIYREVAQRPLALSLQVELRCRLGALYKDKLGLRDRAIATFTRVLDLDAGNAQATAALRDLDQV